MSYNFTISVLRREYATLKPLKIEADKQYHTAQNEKEKSNAQTWRDELFAKQESLVMAIDILEERSIYPEEG